MKLIQPSEGFEPSEGSVIQIIDLLGVVVTNSKGNPTPTLPEGEGVRIDVSFLSSGMYFIKIGKRVEKFVKVYIYNILTKFGKLNRLFEL